MSLLGLMLPSAAYVLKPPVPGAPPLVIVRGNRAGATPCLMQTCECCKSYSAPCVNNAELDSAFLETHSISGMKTAFGSQEVLESEIVNGIVDLEQKEEDEEKTREGGCCSCCPPGCACCETGCRCAGI